MLDENESVPVDLNEVGEYAKAIVNGVEDGLLDLMNDILHPIDNIVLPITDFIHDATVIIAKHSPRDTHNDLAILQNIIERNPRIYSASVLRMQRKLDDLKAAGKFLLNASAPEKVRALTSMATTIWVPGKIFSASKSIIKNVKAFKMPLPPRFHTVPGKQDIDSVKKLSINDIRAINDPYEEQLMYVINSRRELIMAEQDYDHWHLTRAEPAFVAGDFYVEKGRITKINNRSGSYRPSGDHLAKLVENTFVKNGFAEARGKFVEHYAEIEADFKEANYVPSSPNLSTGVKTWLEPASLDGMVFGLYLSSNAQRNQQSIPANRLINTFVREDYSEVTGKFFDSQSIFKTNNVATPVPEFDSELSKAIDGSVTSSNSSNESEIATYAAPLALSLTPKKIHLSKN